MSIWASPTCCVEFVSAARRIPTSRRRPRLSSTSGGGGNSCRTPTICCLSSSERSTPCRSASISSALPPIVPNGVYCPVTNSVNQRARDCPNHACRVEASPKTRSNCRLSAPKSNSVSLTSNTNSRHIVSSPSHDPNRVLRRRFAATQYTYLLASEDLCSGPSAVRTARRVRAGTWSRHEKGDGHAAPAKVRLLLGRRLDHGDVQLGIYALVHVVGKGG